MGPGVPAVRKTADELEAELLARLDEADAQSPPGSPGWNRAQLMARSAERHALAWRLFVDFVRLNPSIPSDATWLPGVWRAYLRTEPELVP